MFGPSLKLERDNAAMAGFPVLIQIGRAKVAAKVSPEVSLEVSFGRGRIPPSQA